MKNSICIKTVRSCALVCLFLFGLRLAGAPPDSWIATWTASPEAADPDPKEPLLKLEGQTVRERVRISIGGAKIRVSFSNEYGSTPLLIGAATVAVPDAPSSIAPGSNQAITFAGHNSTTIPPGASVLSDPVEFPVKPATEISVSVYFPERVATPTLHALALKRAVVSEHGDYTRAEKMEPGTISQSSILIRSILVPVHPPQRVVVAFGDSLTDGDGSTVDTDRNWPNSLIRRLAKSPEGSNVAVVNAGVAGNRLLRDGPFPSFGVSGVARFDREALTVPGVTHIVLLEGLNDISFPGAKIGGRYLSDPADAPTAEDLTGAYQKLIARCHAAGVKIIGGTITPCEGAKIPDYYTEAKEAFRQKINKWIRTSGAFDGVIDFDAVVRDPDHPSQLLPRLASKDHVHPNDDGYGAIADAIDLALFN